MIPFENIKYESRKLSYTLSHTYRPDFVIQQGSSVICIEAKGYWRQKDRSILKAIKEQHPEIDIRMVFQADSKINKNSPTRYSDYCKKNNIKYCVGIIPKEWFNA